MATPSKFIGNKQITVGLATDHSQCKPFYVFIFCDGSCVFVCMRLEYFIIPIPDKFCIGPEETNSYNSTFK